MVTVKKKSKDIQELPQSRSTALPRQQREMRANNEKTNVTQETTITKTHLYNLTPLNPTVI